MTSDTGARESTHTPGRIALSLAVAVLVLIVTLLIPISLSAAAGRALAIALMVLTLWIARPLPHAVSGLIGCYLLWIAGAVPFSTAFSGFAHTTAWFVLAAGLLGAMTTQTGLAHRLAGRILGPSGVSYPRLVFGIILASYLLNFLVPSGIARVTILGGIGLGIVQALGWGRDAVPARGIFVILTASCTLFDKMMITGSTTIMAQGIMESVGHIRVYWSTWLFSHIPTVLLSIPACWILTLRLFPAKEKPRPEALRVRPGSGPWTAAERRCALLLGAALGIWGTDFIHGIHPAAVAFGVALAALIPGLGVLGAGELKSFNFMPFIFTASALSLAESLSKTGALDAVTSAVAAWQPPAAGFLPSAILLYWTGFIYHLLVPSDPATVATSMPTIMKLALTHGWSPFAAGLIWTLSLTGKLFVYQSGVTIAGYSFGYFRERDFLRLGIRIAIFEFLILLLLVVWYWPLIGLVA